MNQSPKRAEPRRRHFTKQALAFMAVLCTVALVCMAFGYGLARGVDWLGGNYP